MDPSCCWSDSQVPRSALQAWIKGKGGRCGQVGFGLVPWVRSKTTKNWATATFAVVRAVAPAASPSAVGAGLAARVGGLGERQRAADLRGARGSIRSVTDADRGRYASERHWM
ncbi:hypothetical protein Psuf_070150 [Phytohabitans suffuscus]|uniref:Uncharacterized protein n=1 Tax=Phytohabitans suffuscus TaxID=624315 RepID=A0A6F8YUA5_9ACTN|nr:hypothetical protein Psuf_070150 [Phytohabitans suffuscus]